MDIEHYRGKRLLIRQEQGEEGIKALAELCGNSPTAMSEFTGVVQSTCTGWLRSVGIKSHKRDPYADRGPRPPATEQLTEDPLDEQLAPILRRSRDVPHDYGKLSELVDRSVPTVRAAMDRLRERGISLVSDETRVSLPTTPQRTGTRYIDLTADETRIGVVSDTHLGHNHCAEDFLAWVYDYYAEQGIEHVLHCGDLTEGPGERGYRGHAYACRDDCQTWRGLERYVSASYPCREGITTHVISSSKSHCGWEYNASGIDMLTNISQGRPALPDEEGPLPPRTDIDYRGHDMADIAFGGVRFRMFHPDGGKAYALSYHLQKFVESIPGGDKPDVLLVGHYHGYCSIRPRNVRALMVPSMQLKSDLFRRRMAESVVGALVLTVQTDTQGSLRAVSVTDLADYYYPERD